MIYDKDILDKLQTACRKHEFTQIIAYDKLFDKLKSYIDKDIENAEIKKSRENIDRIETYLKWCVDWMNKDLHSQAEYLLKKGVIMNTLNKINSKEEKLNNDLKHFQEDIRKKSEYYAKGNSLNE